MIIAMNKKVGDFAENKDTARDIRIKQIEPTLKKGNELIIDFDNVTGTTQSFIHALISDPIRTYGEDFYDMVVFKNCSPTVKEIINIVADYMEESR